MFCPVCYEETNDSTLYHKKCSRKIFGTITPPNLGYKLNEMKVLAEKIVRGSFTVTGVQPKLSLDIEKTENRENRFTLVGLWGNYILKPPTEKYQQLPENESVTMYMAEYCGISTVPNGLLPLASGELAYITKRIDRINTLKLHMEDMCQLTERLTEDKYRGSIEQIGKTIGRFSSNPGFDKVRFFESIIFSYITGNSDMHLKNYSLITNENGSIALAPMYDLLSTHLVIPEDNEESALTINGKKNKLSILDFIKSAESLSIPEKVAVTSIEKIINKANGMFTIINKSYLSADFKSRYCLIISERIKKLSLGHL